MSLQQTQLTLTEVSVHCCILAFVNSRVHIYNFFFNCVFLPSPGPREELIDRLKGYMIQVNATAKSLPFLVLTKLQQCYR